MASSTSTDTQGQQGSNGGGPKDDDEVEKSMEYQLKKYLLLLATLVATVTYAAGLNLPGGSWPEDAPAKGRLAGDSILRETNYTRYIVFYTFNAVSFAASLVVGLLLLVLRRGVTVYLLHFVQIVMVVDLLGLVGAYAAGSSHDRFTTACSAAVLVSAVATYAAVAFFGYVLVSFSPPSAATPQRQAAEREKQALQGEREKQEQEAAEREKQAQAAEREKQAQVAAESEREILLVLAIFAATIAYVAGLNPPGGFWRSTEQGHHTAGDPVLQDLHPGRYRAFFFFNTSAFITSLLAIVLVVDHRRKYFGFGNDNLKGMAGMVNFSVSYVALYGLILTALLGLGGAYAAGSCRDSKHTVYVLSLVAPVVACIILARLLVDKETPTDGVDELNVTGQRVTPSVRNRTTDKKNDNVNKIRDCIQLLATLAATIAYQAGVDPPGGVWSEDGAGHSVGDPILLTMQPGRFKVFFYFNSAAFVASLVIMVMLQKESLIRLHVLEKAMVLDLFALIGAYAAGSCRDTSTSIYTIAMAGAVLVYVVIHIVFFQVDPSGGDGHHQEELDQYREVLLLLATLAATLTYQAGLTPPGGFWEEDDKFGHRAGFPVLQDKHPRRYKAFFYCNAASFMASVALILLLLNANLYRPGIRCYALYVCMVAGMFGLMAAYAAGSSLHLRTSIIALALVLAVFVALVCLAIRLYHVSNKKDGPSPPKKKPGDEPKKEDGPSLLKQEPKQDGPSSSKHESGNEEKKDGPLSTQEPNDEPKKKKEDLMQEYLMLVGILGASVTYLTGLKPPGGMWKDDGGGHSAGNPVLYDTNKRRYNAFFYSNSTAFVASIVVMGLLLSRMMRQWNGHRLPLWPMHTAMFLGLAALLVAYAAGSARDSCTSWQVIVLLVPIVAFVMCLFAFYKEKEAAKGDSNESRV